MKLPLHCSVLATAAFVETAHGFTSVASPPHSSSSSSSARSEQLLRKNSAGGGGIFHDSSSGAGYDSTARSRSSGSSGRPTTRLYYEPPNDQTPTSAETGEGIWTVLANTEKWISDTLERSNRAAAPGHPTGSNPYSRKEVSYVCETVEDLAAVVASAFRRVKDAREMGETHASEQEHILADKGPTYTPKTFRQTNVVVMPSCKGLDNFQTFDKMVSAINQARRNARDYITEVSLDKLDDDMNGEGERDWVVSISCAHLHPKFGEKTPEEILADMQKEDEEGEVDVNAEEYRRRRKQARQSPYPSLVMEVMATPPPDFNQPSPMAVKDQSSQGGEVNEISSDDIKKLEALFGQAATDHPVEEPKAVEDLDAEEEAFWNSFGKLGGIEEISTVTPTSVAHKWVAANEPSYDEAKSTFVSGDVRQVDEAYELVFSTIAMQKNRMEKDVKGVSKDMVPGKRSYFVMPNFLTASATSFERFAMEVRAIVDTIPGLSDELSMSTLHPETVEKEWRSPHPILILQWYDVDEKSK